MSFLDYEIFFLISYRSFDVNSRTEKQLFPKPSREIGGRIDKRGTRKQFFRAEALRYQKFFELHGAHNFSTTHKPHNNHDGEKEEDLHWHCRCE